MKVEIDYKGLEKYIRGKTNTEYELTEADGNKIIFLTEFINDGMTVIDAGAFVGTFTTLLDMAVLPHGKVYAFEPQEDNFNKLLNSTDSSSRITCINSALSDYHGRGKLCPFNEVTPQAYFMVEIKDFGEENIDVTYIDKFCKDNNITKVDLIKIDVEGQCLKVLKGAEYIINTNKDIIIMIEIHQGNDKPVLTINEDSVATVYLRNRFPNQKKEIHEFFISKGFKLYDLENKFKDITNDPVSGGSSITEILAMRGQMEAMWVKQ